MKPSSSIARLKQEDSFSIVPYQNISSGTNDLSFRKELSNVLLNQ